MIINRKFRTKKAQEKERKRLIIKSIIITIIVIIVFTLFSYVVNLKSLKIYDIKISTNGILEEEVIKNAIDSDIDNKYFWILPKRTILRFRYNSLENKLKNDFPRIKTISIKRKNISSLFIKIEEREPKALWCGDIVPPIANQETSEEMRKTESLWGTCYLIDKTAFIYAKAPVFSGNVFPRYYGSLEHSEPIGQKYLPTKEYTEWQNFYSELEKNKLPPQALLFVDEKDVELYVSNGLKILIPRNEDKEKIKKRISAVLNSGNVKKNDDIEYVDLRFGNKAFIKYLDKKTE